MDRKLRKVHCTSLCFRTNTEFYQKFMNKLFQRAK